MTVDEVMKEIIRICKDHEADDFEALEEKIADIPTLYIVDMVDMGTCRNSLLMEDIELYGRKIYEKT